MSIYTFPIIKNGNSNLSSGSQASGQQANQVKINILPIAGAPNLYIRVKGSLKEFPPDFTSQSADWQYVSFVENESTILYSGATGLLINSIRPISIVLAGGNYYWFTVEIFNYVSGVVDVEATIIQ